MKISDDFRLELNPSRAYQKTDTFRPCFRGSEDEWDTKEDPGKSMKNALHI